MCVAAVITGASPTLADLQDMEAENPHGAGLAWKEPGDNRVTYRKGLTAAEVHEVLDNLPRPVLLHFRWSTAGSKGKHLTHPFPLGNEALLNTALSGTTKAVMIHNGTWREWKLFVPEWAKKWDISDTAVAAYWMKSRPQLAHKIRWAVAVGYAKGRNKPMRVSKYGSTWIQYKDNWYSNLNWVDSIADARAKDAAMAERWARAWSPTTHLHADSNWWRKSLYDNDFVQDRNRRAAKANRAALIKDLATRRADPPRPEYMTLGRGPLPEPGKETLMDRLADEDEARTNADAAFYDEFQMPPEEDLVDAADRLETTYTLDAEPQWDAVTQEWVDAQGNLWNGHAGFSDEPSSELPYAEE